MNMTQADLARLYTILGAQTPLSDDCGRLCGGACCEEDGETLCGVDLLPAEADTLRDAGWADIVNDPVSGRPMLVCRDRCDRDRRPWLCRIFPLCPVEGGRRVRMDARARAVCPLTGYGLRSLDPEFKKAVSRSALFLSSFEDGHAFLNEWEETEKEFRSPLW